MSSQKNDWRVEIIKKEEKYAFGNLFRIIHARLRHRSFNGKMSRELTRVNFERGESVAVLLYVEKQDAVALVRQFRYPVYASLSEAELEEAGAKRAWVWEIVAGGVEGGSTAEETARKELLEESGYEARHLKHMVTIYPSPGGTSERIALFLARVDFDQVRVIPFAKAMEMVERGEIQDAKTIIALQYLALRKRSSNIN